jgi:membrane protein required for colicin V production
VHFFDWPWVKWLAQTSAFRIESRGGLLGACRIVLLAVLLVLVFDRTIPSGREPAFLKESQWRPVLSSAAQYGLQSLPPEVEDYIDRLKRQRRI